MIMVGHFRGVAVEGVAPAVDHVMGMTVLGDLGLLPGTDCQGLNRVMGQRPGTGRQDEPKR